MTDSKVGWSEYASRKYASASGLSPPIHEYEMVKSLIRHFDETVVEAARCRNISNIDELLVFLDHMQAGGRSNSPRTN